MNKTCYRANLFFLIILPLLLMACSFSANLGKEEKLAVPAAGDMPCSTPESAAGTVSSTLGTNVAIDKEVILHGGGVNYPAWGNANDSEDYGKTTQAEDGRWGNHTNGEGGTYQVIDLGGEYTLNGVGYRLDWDAAFGNPLTFQVLVSTDLETWILVTNTVHRYSGGGTGSQVDIDLAIAPIRARYVKYWEPPDGAWNGWGDLYQVRAYAAE